MPPDQGLPSHAPVRMRCLVDPAYLRLARPSLSGR
jgi:hypothetical protein